MTSRKKGQNDIFWRKNQLLRKVFFCDTENVASDILQKKLGFQKEKGCLLIMKGERLISIGLWTMYGGVVKMGEDFLSFGLKV